MSQLFEASRQWANRPADQRFTSLHALGTHFSQLRDDSRATVVSSRRVQAAPAREDEKNGLVIYGPSGSAYAPTHHAFGQLSQLAGAPAGYLRTLPAPVAADCINYGLQFSRDVEDVGLLLQRGGTLRAATGPRYGRIWNDDIVRGLVDTFGDGITGRFKVPGEFGQDVAVTKANTTLYGSDRDMFVFLADEHNRISIDNRRDGRPGSLARGFFCWNSEVGSATFGIKAFLFDYVCCNRIVWGAQDVQTLTIRHTASAPDKFLEQAEPVLLAYANSSAHALETTLANAQRARLDNVDEWLAKRFGARTADKVSAAHMADEGRPIETIWDAVTGATAYARTIANQDARVDFETAAGSLLDLV